MYFFSLTDIPAADEIKTEINYSQEDKHITASLTFQSNQNQYIEEEQTTQWSNEKV
jgi:hypothetical protein